MSAVFSASYGDYGWRISEGTGRRRERGREKEKEKRPKATSSLWYVNPIICFSGFRSDDTSCSKTILNIIQWKVCDFSCPNSDQSSSFTICKVTSTPVILCRTIQIWCSYSAVDRVHIPLILQKCFSGKCEISEQTQWGRCAMHGSRTQQSYPRSVKCICKGQKEKILDRGMQIHSLKPLAKVAEVLDLLLQSPYSFQKI